MNKVYLFLNCAISIILVLASIFSISLFFSGPRVIGALETIHGIPFVTTQNYTLVTESLAHSDIFLKESILGKELSLTVTFKPEKIKKLSAGIRENSFWLSYTPTVLYDITQETIRSDEPITKTISLPLTDKLQDTNRSVDLMFFADDAKEKNLIDQKVADKTEWQLLDIKASVTPVMPTRQELKDYFKSIIYREKAI